MKNLMKCIGVSFIRGAAVAAGYSLWKNVLEDKVINLAHNIEEKNVNRNGKGS